MSRCDQGNMADQTNTVLPLAVQSTIYSTIPNVTSATTGASPWTTDGRKRCQIRGPSHRNKTRFVCRKCGVPMCKEHFRVFFPNALLKWKRCMHFGFCCVAHFNAVTMWKIFLQALWLCVQILRPVTLVRVVSNTLVCQ